MQSTFSLIICLIDRGVVTFKAQTKVCTVNCRLCQTWSDWLSEDWVPACCLKDCSEPDMDEAWNCKHSQVCCKTQSVLRWRKQMMADGLCLCSTWSYLIATENTSALRVTFYTFGHTLMLCKAPSVLTNPCHDQDSNHWPSVRQNNNVTIHSTLPQFCCQLRIMRT